jgi:NADH-quinone oxidoreductase subunit N
MTNIESIKAYFSSELVLILGVFLLLFVAIRKKKNTQPSPGVLTLITLLLSLFALVFTHFTESVSLFSGMIALDPFGQFFKVIIISVAVVCVVMASRSKDIVKMPRPEFYAFLLFLTLSLNILCVANHLLTIYLAVEMSSLVSYMLTVFLADDSRSEEAGLKYVLYGGVASGIMIFGMSLLYGLTGHLGLAEIRGVLEAGQSDPLVLFLATLMIFTGLGYKMAVAPFHMWSPDVYEGAPMPVTAYLSVASKAGAFAITLRFFLVGFSSLAGNDLWVALGRIDWPFLIAALSALTMTVGNVIALHQKNIKRFLAYSSIAHAGYLLMGVAAVSRIGVEAIMFYFIIYLLMNLGAFFVATIMANQFQTENMDDYKGLIKQGSFGTFLAISMTIFLFSLTGIPPFAGFVAKWYIFQAVVDAQLYWLAVVGVVNAGVALFYYVRLIKYMVIDEKQSEMPVKNINSRYISFIAVFVFFTLFFGLYFAPIANWVKASAHLLY